MDNDTISTQASQQYLTFRMDNEQYAASVLEVESVLEHTGITKIPGTEEAMKGVINLRGRALPIIDLRLKVGLPEKEKSQDTAIIVLNIDQEGETLTMGMMVDAVQEVIPIDEEQIQPAPQIGLKIDSSFIRGITNQDDRFIIILDIRHIFSDKELEVLSDVQESGESLTPSDAPGPETAADTESQTEIATETDD